MGFLSTMFTLFFVISFSFPSAYSHCNKSPVIFNFGDSNSDTGRARILHESDRALPYGETYFGKISGRESDGRLIIDFLCENLNTGFLNPYDETLSGNYSNGANFAICGSSILSDYSLPIYKKNTLANQVKDFLNFRSSSLEKISQGRKDMVNEEGFQNALYIIDIGLGDITFSLLMGHLTLPTLKARNDLLMAAVRDNIMTLHKNGARNFWVHNSAPLGCVPNMLNEYGPGGDFDDIGCIKSHNEISKSFNDKLRELYEDLRSELKDSTFVYVDIHNIKYDVMANATTYGFVDPLVACCGSGPYNGDLIKQCGNPEVKPCQNPSKSIWWDLVHCTEAANKVFTSKILAGYYSIPAQTKLNFFCN